MSNPNENAVEKAARLGAVLVQPAPNELFVDLDSRVALDRFRDLFADQFVQVFPLASVEYTTSLGGNWHAYITVPEVEAFTMQERIALQAALGSDPLREIIAIKHHRDGYEYASVFFEKPGELRRPDAIAMPLSLAEARP